MIELFPVKYLHAAAEDADKTLAGKLFQRAGNRFSGAADALCKLFLGELQGVSSEPGSFI